MKKLFIALLFFTALFCLHACTDGFSRTQASFEAAATPSPLPPATLYAQPMEALPEEAVPEQSAFISWESMRLAESSSATGGTDLMFLAELANISDTPVAVYMLELDILGADDKLLKRMQLPVYPSILEPGQTGYVCDLIVNSIIDVEFATSQVQTVTTKGKFATLTALPQRKRLDVQIANPELNMKFGRPNFVCEITNHEDKELDPLYVACPVFSAEGGLLSVIFLEADHLKAGETVSINQMAVIYDESAEYSTATIRPFVYIDEVLDYR